MKDYATYNLLKTLSNQLRKAEHNKSSLLKKLKLAEAEIEATTKLIKDIKEKTNG